LGGTCGGAGIGARPKKKRKSPGRGIAQATKPCDTGGPGHAPGFKIWAWGREKFHGGNCWGFHEQTRGFFPVNPGLTQGNDRAKGYAGIRTLRQTDLGQQGSFGPNGRGGQTGRPGGRKIGVNSGVKQFCVPAQPGPNRTKLNGRKPAPGNDGFQTLGPLAQTGRLFSLFLETISKCRTLVHPGATGDGNYMGRQARPAR